MAGGPVTQIADVIVPEIFTPYVQQLTEEKARLVQSRVLSRDPLLDNLLAGGGTTFKVPSFKDLDSSDSERVSTDVTGGFFTGAVNPDPFKTGTAEEIAVRLNRNASWSSADLTATLAGADPMQSIAARVGYYWTRRLQKAFVAVMTGIYAQNALSSPVGAVQNDMTVDISGSSFTDGVTNFSAESFIDAATTMGDSADEIVAIMVHSVVYSRMQKNNLIDFIPDARGEIQIPTFLGREVIVDDGVPKTGSVYQNWLFGAGALKLGVGTPKVATEIQRFASGGNGGGQDVLYNRVEWSIHPVGHKYAGSASGGGPDNSSSSNMLANSGSWNRVFTERKQIHMARLVTREA